MIIVIKLVLAKCVGLTATAGRKMNVVFLVNVLIEAVQDVLIILIVALGIIVVRKDTGMPINLANVVQTVLGNRVLQAMIVVVQKMRWRISAKK